MSLATVSKEEISFNFDIVFGKVRGYVGSQTNITDWRENGNGNPYLAIQNQNQTENASKKTHTQKWRIDQKSDVDIFESKLSVARKRIENQPRTPQIGWNSRCFFFGLLIVLSCITHRALLAQIDTFH